IGRFAHVMSSVTEIITEESEGCKWAFYSGVQSPHISGSARARQGHGFEGGTESALDAAGRWHMFDSPKRSALISRLLHAGVITVVVLATGVKPPVIFRPLYTPLTTPWVGAYRPPIRHELTGGRGGGARDQSPPLKGELPKTSPRPFVMPVVV